ncbi:selenate reductase subunit YgfN [Escherichia coli]|nr:selenate reductase subunit YgfN [Escherichia coli]
MAHRKVTSLITMALAELAEQLQIDQLEIIERNRVHEGQELKILGAIGER